MLYLYTMKNKKSLTYGEVVELIKTERPIQDHVFKNYPMDFKVLGRYGHGMTDTSRKNTLRFAQKNNDVVLIELIKTHQININRIYNS